MPSRTRRMAALTGIAALAFAASAGTTADAAAKTLTYDCTALGSVPVGEWTVALDMELPETVTAGSTMEAPKVTATVTTSESAADTLRTLLSADKVAGTGTAAYSIDDTSFDAKLNVPETQVPESGPVTVDASGAGQSAKAPGAPTTSTVIAGDFKADLTVTKKDGSTSAVPIACTLSDNSDATLGTIKVVADDDEPTPTETSEDPTSTTTSSSSSSSSSSTATDPTSSTSASSTTSQPAPSSSESTMGPKVDTGVVSDGANGETIALGVLALSGVVGAGLASRRRLNR